MIVELHLIQNFAPSCLNRDDTNSPKDCEFGGHRRARISSQCIKRSIRKSDIFRETVEQVGTRTKLLLEQLKLRLTSAGRKANEIDNIVPTFVASLVSKLDKEKTAVLLYLGDDEIDRMKDFLLRHWEKLSAATQKSTEEAEAALNDIYKESAKDFKSGSKAADIALFGRMMAEHPAMAVEAACQVAHAISTNKVLMDMDFYTAVDDLQPEAETGAGMMGITGFNSSCFYRYSLVDLGQLKENLGGDEKLARKTLEAFLRASVTAIPTGKQNSMAAQNQPDAILAIVRDKGAPISLANAFATPVHPTSQKSLVQVSIEAIDSYWGKLTKVYGENGIKICSICLVEEAELKALKDRQCPSLEELIKKVLEALSFGGE